MPTVSPDEQKTLQALLEEATRLAGVMPGSHQMATEVQAVVLIAKMHGHGFQVVIADAERCVERMRIAVATGAYPQLLLDEANAAAKELHSNL